MGLVKGKPCPVCGSTCHPQKAKIVHEVVDEQKLRELKDDYERSAKMDEQILGDASKLKGSMEQLEQDIHLSVRPYRRRMKLGKSTDLGIMRERIRLYLEKLMQEIQTDREKLTKVEELMTSIQKYVDGQKQLALDYKRDKERYDDTGRKLHESEVALSKLSGERSQLESQCPAQYKSKTAVDHRIRKLLMQQQNLNIKIKNITEAKENLQSEKSGQEIRLEQMLSGLDRTLLNEELNQLTKKMKDVKKEKGRFGQENSRFGRGDK